METVELVKQAENKQSVELITNNNMLGRGGFGDHPENINHNGRPKKGSAWADILREVVEQVAPDSGGKTVKELIALRLVKECLNGNIRAMKELFNRTEGLPKARAETAGPIRDGSDKIAELLQYMCEVLHEDEELERQQLPSSDT